jgi:hypothetical protein
MKRALVRTTILDARFAPNQIIPSHYFFAMGKEAVAKGLAITTAWDWTECQKATGFVHHVSPRWS